MSKTGRSYEKGLYLNEASVGGYLVLGWKTTQLNMECHLMYKSNVMKMSC